MRTLVNIWVDDCSNVNFEGREEAITHFEFLLMREHEVLGRAEQAARSKFPHLAEWIFEEELPLKAMLAMKEGELAAAAMGLGNRHGESIQGVMGLMTEYRRLEEETKSCQNAFKRYYNEARIAIRKAMNTLQNHIFKKKVCVLKFQPT